MKGSIIDHTSSAKLENIPDPKVGQRFFLPTSNGETYPVHVIGTSPRGILIQAGEDVLLVERQSFADFAIPFPSVKIESILPDEDTRIIFVRYSFNSTWVDKLYNWYVKIVKKNVDI